MTTKAGFRDAQEDGYAQVSAWEREANKLYTPAEKQAIYQYSVGYYRDINEYLRLGAAMFGPNPGPYAEINVQDMIRPLRTAMAKTLLPESVILHRGIDFRVSEYAYFDDILRRDGMHAFDGQRYSDKAFLSTSFGVSPWDSKALQFRIAAPAGTHVLFPNVSEREVLLPPHAVLLIKNVVRDYYMAGARILVTADLQCSWNAAGHCE